MTHARRLHSTLIEEEGALEAELQALTRAALADQRLLAALGTPVSTLTSHALVPFAPALNTWLAERAETMSPLLRHTLAADTTPSGFTGAFGHLAKTLAESATGTDIARTGRRLPIPPQWEQHATAVDALLDAAAADPRVTALVISNDPSDGFILASVRNWILDHVVTHLSAPGTPGDEELTGAFFGDTDTLDSLLTHITAQTAQSARTGLIPEPAALFAVYRGNSSACAAAAIWTRGSAPTTG